MIVRWNSSPRDCDGHMRETGVEYDDFTSRALADLLQRGFISPVDAEATALAATLAKAAPEAAPAPAPEPAAPAATDESKE